MIIIKWLPVSVCHKEWLFESFQERNFPDICRRVMNKYTWFYISICIDMAIISSSCDTSSDKLSIILEIHRINWLSACHTADLSYPVIHIFSLFFCRQQIRCCIISNRHIMEIPGETTSLSDDHIQEFIRCNRFNVLSGITDRRTKDQSIFL